MVNNSGKGSVGDQQVPDGLGITLEDESCSTQRPTDRELAQERLKAGAVGDIPIEQGGQNAG